MLDFTSLYSLDLVVSSFTSHLKSIEPVQCPNLDAIAVSTEGVIQSMLTSSAAMALGLPTLSDALTEQAVYESDVTRGLETCDVVNTAYIAFDSSLIQGVDASATLGLSLGIHAIIEIQVVPPCYPHRCSLIHLHAHLGSSEFSVKSVNYREVFQIRNPGDVIFL